MTNLSDSGWDGEVHHSSIGMGDVAGDGRADVCRDGEVDEYMPPDSGEGGDGLSADSGGDEGEAEGGDGASDPGDGEDGGEAQGTDIGDCPADRGAQVH